MSRNWFVLICLFLFVGFLADAASIKGKIALDDSWAPVVYISVIHDFDDLQTASYDFLRYQIELDADGFFEVDSLELEGGDRLYRLHVCKKSDPVSTIMIGGQEENFIHFLMNEHSDIRIRADENHPGFQYYTIEGHPSGDILAKLFELQKKLNTPPELPSAQNRSFVRSQILSDYKTITDTASNPIVRLLGLHLIRDNFTDQNHLAFMERLQGDLESVNHSSPYYAAFEKRLDFLRFQEGALSSGSAYSWLKWLGLVLLFVLISLFSWREMQRPSIRKKGRTAQKIGSLSSQEKRVFNLLKKGKSNKEISSELHIEVSTVKSHLNKIYSRLGVKSRKEIINKDW